MTEAAVPRPPARKRRTFIPTEEHDTVTTLELFFDLVFVFAITQVTAFMADHLGWQGAARGLVVLALLWWAWCSYAWLGNQARADEGVVRAAMIVAMGALFVVALSLPEAWDDEGGALSAPLVLACALSMVRIGHLVVYAVAAGDDRELRRQLARSSVPVGIAAVLLVSGAVAGGPTQTLLWALALVIDYTGIYLAGVDGWRVPAPGHFAERHGLIVIIALGESLIAVGVGMSGFPLTGPAVMVALLGLTVAVALWWSYFDVVAPVAERRLEALRDPERARLARDSYTYLHFPMVAGIIFSAVGLKKVAEYVADTEHHSLADAIPTAALWPLFGGAAVYLLAHLGFRYRNIGSINIPRGVTAAALLLAPLFLGDAPALLSLGTLSTALVALTAFEVMRYADGRDRIRHGTH
jgi:low temperature requirement protein LtrA